MGLPDGPSQKGKGLKIKLKLGGKVVTPACPSSPTDDTEDEPDAVLKPAAGRAKRGSLKRKAIQEECTIKSPSIGMLAGVALGEEYDVEDDDWAEEEGPEEASFRLGEQDEQFHDYTGMHLKDDSSNRPLYVCPDGRIFLETRSPIYKQASDFLIAISEPVCRPECVHEYVLTPHSLYAAVSVGLETATVITVLNRLSKVPLPAEIKDFIIASTSNYGKVKLVLKHNKFFVESPFPEVLRQILRDPIIDDARVEHSQSAKASGAGFVVSSGIHDRGAQRMAGALETIDLTGDGAGGDDEEAAAAAEAEASRADDGLGEDPNKKLHSFEIYPAKVEHVKARCLPGGLNYPMLEEYDFKNDDVNAVLPIDLKPHVILRPFQQKSMSKMFGNGRARSGIIVLPCGAGKSLVGISAASRIKKSCLVLCTNSVSVDQWRHQFLLWSTADSRAVGRFTSGQKEPFLGASSVLITTYTMIAYSGRRSEESAKVMEEIQSREWGLLLLDEVHVVPAQMFRKVIGIVKAHTKLGLTATLVREDDRISDLNFLIGVPPRIFRVHLKFKKGPKLYEANWLDLTKAGHIANVQCAEVWCPMTREFYREYLKKENAARRQLLYIMNPTKFQSCEFLVQHHEQMGDKIIVFSDNIFALREYAVRMRKPYIYGATSHPERTRILHAFKRDPKYSTVFLSKVGDNSIDIPEANVLIQISSHGGSRRQEAQRLGRILRAKKAKPGALGAGTEFNAFFYTLVSKDTQEMYYSTKRQQFLIDQGYSFKVITNLLDNQGSSLLQLSSKKDQLDVLAQVLAAGAGDAAEEADEATDDIGNRRGAARRTNGQLSSMSGAGGLSYMEYDTGGAPGSGVGGGRGRGGGGSGQRRAGGHSNIFRKALRN